MSNSKEKKVLLKQKAIQQLPGQTLRVEGDSCPCLSRPHHLLPLQQRVLRRPSCRDDRLPRKLGDSAEHPVLLSPGENYLGKFLRLWKVHF